jgi:hypothetical protein
MKSVQLNAELWVDFYDRVLAETRANEPKSLFPVKKRFHRRMISGN